MWVHQNNKSILCHLLEQFVAFEGKCCEKKSGSVKKRYKIFSKNILPPLKFYKWETTNITEFK